jgi:hypothetical protein
MQGEKQRLIRRWSRGYDFGAVFSSEFHPESARIEVKLESLWGLKGF